VCRFLLLSSDNVVDGYQWKSRLFEGWISYWDPSQV
jgi:hypothetical protein